MGRPLVIAWRESEDDLRERWKAEMDPARHRRLHALWLLRRGYSGRSVCDILDMDYKTFQAWVGWYREGGIDLLLSRTPGHAIGGDEEWLTPDQVRQLRDKVQEGSFATAADARDWIEATFGVRYAVNSLSRVFARHDIVLKRPRPRHEKQKEGAVEAFKKGALPTP